MSFYIDELLFVLIAFVSTKQQVNATWAFRTYAPAHTVQSKMYHVWGACFTILIGFICAYAFGKDIKEQIILVILNGFIYWLLFDILYAKGIGQKWYYLGNEAKTDSKLTNLFGKNVGKKKAILCILIILILNIAKAIFL